jgi:hypothetical protein
MQTGGVQIPARFSFMPWVGQNCTYTSQRVKLWSARRIPCMEGKIWNMDHLLIKDITR